ncbi:helix-turn-helix domain-containing protein [Catenovulum sp. 2E275]|uniref:helix-turn-helix transcriptional regulator n=1 Tax=Catenovulum sp. 2E275 TaxID=2980497 RepID=UPI0021D2B097|nr:helix-turn-helix domain-containing protein [Catenovulum sp. 2E275]MCU4676398.1 helix-turn-helix domain-containing protein [Catenovulum sp. 2E275]
MEKMFYRSEEVADLLFISKQALFNQISKNKQGMGNYQLPPYIKIGSRLLFPVDEFHEWLESQPRFK